MATFDPTKPIDDPVVWYPQGMYIQQKTRVGDDQVFILSSTDMSALNRYAWTGRLLATTRDDYKASIGISDASQLSDSVWSAVDTLLGKYSTIKSDTTQFLDVTWPGIVDLANKIYDFSALAGGTQNSSYYANMLKWVGAYNDELQKPDPDENMLLQYQLSIQQITKQMYDKTQTLQVMASQSKQALKDFEEATRISQNNVHASDDQLTSILEGEEGEVAELRKQLNDALAKVDEYQKEVDADRLAVEDTGAYSWIPFFGTIATPIIWKNYAEIKELEAAISSLKSTIEQTKAKLEAALRLQADITSITIQVDSLSGLFGPAIETLEKLQGAWEVMGADLLALNGLFTDSGATIPPMLMAQLQLNQIMEQWNTLKDYVNKYREVAYLSDQPSKESLDNFLAELRS
ncbi:hypothetical protein F5B22DRAFT_506483 [Xylaria bambusicola]|uniref:uncharacterized protein n=1 Tax=Xylaria bambusicola TaxID=326684 RepID=UPI00200762E8|nr:uncharacterized protein F5B22DRAFT_506483 [Xylaria bambusicola]KAI0521855.1 hypothetical protein F5B22DRAFT_506483 [Xylaria bambusicola]